MGGRGMIKPAENSTDDPPIKIEDLRLREYVYSLRRRIEVQNCLVEALNMDLYRLKQERDGLATHIERLLLDLHWYESGRSMKE